jgi:hypothetical protein
MIKTRNLSFGLMLAFLVEPMQLIGKASPALREDVPVTNSKMLEFARQQLGKTVGDGGCASFVILALEYAKGGSDYGRILGDQTDARPGDILSFDSAVFKGPHGEYRLGGPDHYAIINAVRGPRVYEIYDQNGMSGRKVGLNTIYLFEIKEGTYQVSRPAYPVSSRVTRLVEEKKEIFIKDRATGCTLFEKEGKVFCGSGRNQNDKWIAERFEKKNRQDFFSGGKTLLRFKNVGTGHWQHIEHKTGYVECTAVNDGWWSAQWTLTGIDAEALYIKNRFQPDKIVMDSNGEIRLLHDIPAGSNMGQWLIDEN